MDRDRETTRESALRAVVDKLLADLACLRGDIASCSLCPGGGRGFPGAGSVGAELYLLAGRPGPGAKPENPWGDWWNALGAKMRRRWGWGAEEIYMATALRCRLSRNTRADIRRCAPYLAEEILIVGPRLVLACGRAAAVALREALGQEIPEEPRAGDVCSFFSTRFLFQFDVSRLAKEPELEGPFWRIMEKCDGLLHGKESS